MNIDKKFTEFSNKVAKWTGSHWAFTISTLSIFAWGFTGPMMNFSDTWQLLINTPTTILTFLMVFVIQNTQNRDSKALHLKLDELIASQNEAHNKYIGSDHDTETEIDQQRADQQAELSGSE